MAVNSTSKLRDILADERAVAIINEYFPGFTENAAEMGPCMGMKINTLLKFPQVGLSKEAVSAICEKLDALD